MNRRKMFKGMDNWTEKANTLFKENNFFSFISLIIFNFTYC